MPAGAAFAGRGARQPRANDPPGFARTSLARPLDCPPGRPGRRVRRVHFRKTLELPARPDSFVVHVSADNRYKLYVNGRQVSLGPARGDLDHWFYETVNIAPHLKAGKNVLAAVVWNGGEHVPFAQMTYRTAFILQGNTEAEKRPIPARRGA
jgi:hypothetical protein